MARSDAVGSPAVDISLIAGWPGARALTSSPNSGVLLVNEPALATGGRAESRLMARNTRPVMGWAWTEAGNEISNRGDAAARSAGAGCTAGRDTPGVAPEARRARARLMLRIALDS